jgi:serine/threonine-protein kinase
MKARLEQRRGNRAIGLVAAAAGVVVVGGFLLSAQVSGQEREETASGAVYYQPPAVVITSSEPETWAEEAPTYGSAAPDEPGGGLTGGTTNIPTGDPAAELRALAASDLPTLRNGTEGAWVAQLGSKRPGMVVGGIYYDDSAILEDHLALRSSYSDVRLVWSGDWATFSAPDFWVTLVSTPYRTPEEANAWCDDHGIPPDGCYAKRVSTTGAGDGNTRPR